MNGSLTPRFYHALEDAYRGLHSDTCTCEETGERFELTVKDLECCK